jgi:hypothetical protein
MVPEGLLPCFQDAATELCCELDESVYILTFYFFKIHFSFVLLCMLSGHFPSRFSHKILNAFLIFFMPLTSKWTSGRDEKQAL